jgi:5-methylcytosine-specific restriction enzyme subunit McrC
VIISRGRWHKLNCTYDSFNIDNRFNRIIKYVATLLFNETYNTESKKLLREILFILDEVSDVKIKAEDCKIIRFNQAFSKFETVRDYCYLFLRNSISVEYKNNLKLFAFLLPMEYVFEDFIFGFIDRDISLATAQSQSRIPLDNGEKFTLKPDLLIQAGNRRFIADTKYKMIYSDDKDPKNGISQSDLYQMIAYGIRFNVNEIKLFYPDTINGYNENENEIIIKDELADGTDINIKCFQLPIINHNLFSDEYLNESELSKLFQPACAKLKARLVTILQGDTI